MRPHATLGDAGMTSNPNHIATMDASPELVQYATAPSAWDLPNAFELSGPPSILHPKPPDCLDGPSNQQAGPRVCSIVLLCAMEWTLLTMCLHMLRPRVDLCPLF